MSQNSLISIRKQKQLARNRSAVRRAAQCAIYEPLEDRRLFTLLGISVASVFPDIQSLSPGTLQDQAAPASPSLVGAMFSATSTNLALNRQVGALIEQDLISSDPSSNPPIPNVSSIQILVNSSGQETGGNGPVDGPTTDDLLIVGKVTDPSNNVLFDGVLLTGSILQFGYQFNNAPAPFPSTANFDFRFHVNGGMLDIPGYFAGSDIGMTYTGQASAPFSGTPFTDGFSLTAPKASVFPLTPVFQNINISGTKFNDLIGNSFSSDDQPEQGVTINLYQGTSATGAPLASTITAADGTYSFSNIGAGTYFVQEALPLNTTETGGSAGYTINALSGQNSIGNNFDDFTNINISGTKFNDITGNGFSSDDTSLSGVTIDLFQNGGATPIATTVTDTNGNYSFNDLAPGAYTVQEVVPAGSTQTGGNAGYTINAASGQNSTGNNFDDFQNISISGTKFNDVTGNGFSSDDTGLAGVTIDLFQNGGATPIATTITGANGNYSFSNLAPGIYTVQEVVPAGSTQTGGNSGYTTAANSGVNVTGNNFDDFQNISISGTKFNDVTGNGFSSDDTGLAGVTIDLFQNGGATPFATTITGANGNYSFNNLVPAIYTVQEVVPSGSTQTGGNAGYTTAANSGANVTGDNFDDFQNINISGTKFNDLTGNGFSSDDAGLAGVTIDLFQNGGATPIATTVTGSNGSYSFTNLTPATYTVQEVVPAGSTQTGGNAGYTTVANSGANVTGDNFDDFQNITVTGTKFNDLTGNSFSSDDQPQGGVTINLYLGTSAAGTLLATTTTATNGTYSFPNLGPGTYFVQETTPLGTTQTGGNAGYTIVATSGSNSSGNNFDNFSKISISGTKFNDVTGNGFSSDDTGLAGVTVDLFQNAGTTPIATTTTAAGGTYSFTNLGPGNYSVQEVVPAGSTQTGGTSGYLTSAASGQNVTGDNFDDFQNVSISGTKFNDVTGNGFSSDDTGLAGVTIDLFKNGAATPIATTTTAAGGAYSFTNLGPGSYSVQEVVPTGSTQTGGTSGYSTTAASGQNVTGDNFDDFQNISISGKKTTDITGNGFSTDDTGLAGVTINLFKNGGATPIATTTTAAGGSYSFSNLAPGTYSVQEVVPTGWTQTGGIGGYTTAAVSGQNISTDNFDDFQNISISGKKTTDLTGNGFSTDDTGLAGVTINLFKNGSTTAIATTTTAANGTYSFPNLVPGSYSVQEVVPTGWSQTGGNGGYTTVPNSGVNITTDNFDDFKNISISGIKYTDITGNGSSSDDTGLAGVTINLFKNGGTTAIASTTTTAGGAYSFTNLGPGSYTVQEVVPTGWTQTVGNAGYTTVPTSGYNVTGDNFEDFQNITISGKKYQDLTDNGFSADDTGLGGVTIDLFKNGGTTAVATAVTASDGTYSFINLSPGTYFVQEVVPAGWLQTGGNAGYTTAAKSGQNCSGDNFDDFQLITISGTKYNDLTGNGFSSDDTPLGGVTIKLFKDANNDGVLTSADSAAIATAVTASNGTYSFANLLPGTYFAQEVVPTGWISTGPTSITYYTIKTSAGGKLFSGNNFDNYYEECKLSNTSSFYYTINGGTTHYTTLNGNVHEGDQITVYFTLLSPDTISLVSYTAPEATFVAADASKQVLFDQATGSFSAGLHSLTITVPMCYFQIDFVCGTVINQFGPAGSNIFYNNQARLFDSDNGGTDACYAGGANLSGYVFNDLNSSKTFTATDTGIAGVVITLTGTDSAGHAVKLTRLTGANGYYYFMGLRAGNYTLTETQPTGYVDSVNLVGTVNGVTDGTAKAITGGDQMASIVLALTSTGTNYDFGEIKK